MTLAVAMIEKNECPYLAEWLAFHSLMGVSHFRIYDNGSSDGSLELLHRLAGHFNIQVIPWTESGYLRQQSAFEDGARALAGHYDFVAFLDADEFLFAPDFRPLSVVLAEFPADVGAIGINQRVFGSSGQREGSDAPVIGRFTRRAKPNYSEHYWIKTIARPECVRAFHLSHAVALAKGCYVLGDGGAFGRPSTHPGQTDRIAAQGPVLHHYMLKSLAEFRAKQARGAISDRGSFTRLTNDYFEQRDLAVNEEEDTTLARWAAAVSERVKVALAVTAPPGRPELPLTPLGRRVPLAELVSTAGFYAADKANLTWVKEGPPAQMVVNVAVERLRLRFDVYLFSKDYPLAETRICVNGAAVAWRSQINDNCWGMLETEPLAMQPGCNEITVALPCFLAPAEASPSSVDTRRLAVAFTAVTLLP